MQQDICPLGHEISEKSNKMYTSSTILDYVTYFQDSYISHWQKHMLYFSSKWLTTKRTTEEESRNPGHHLSVKQSLLPHWAILREWQRIQQATYIWLAIPDIHFFGRQTSINGAFTTSSVEMAALHNWEWLHFIVWKCWKTVWIITK